MGSARKSWPARAVAAMAALALALACTFSAYAHAAGHHHPAGQAALGAVAHVAHALHAEKGSGHEHAGHSAGHSHEHGHADGGSGYGGDGCNIMCTGGFAILVATTVVIEHPPAAAPVAEPEAPLDSAESGGLERPPRTSVPA